MVVSSMALASILSTSSTAMALSIAFSEMGKSDLNQGTSELKQPLSSESLKRDKSTVQRSHKPLQKNPFTTYRDPVTGQWLVERNKR